mgnify:CR=1 FL=1|tara:strand:- start:3383 stop:3637 length:255 start_codon:yes stop_codon:yes gene_type:complete
MKYVVVERATDNIKGKINAVDENGVIVYFTDKMKISEENFKKQFYVTTEPEWQTGFKNNLQNRQLDKRKFEWWKDEGTYLDIDS